MSRETRLLVATIGVSVLVLLALSRFRFPERPTIVASPGPPLERLAARATYDELSGIVAGLAPKISPNLVVLRVAPEPLDEPRTLADVLSRTTSHAAVNHVPALRVGQSIAVAAVEPTDRILGIVGDAGGAMPRLDATDAVRRLGIIRVPLDSLGSTLDLRMSDLQAPTYVVVVEGTRAGLTFRPVFVGSSDRFQDPRWGSELLAVSSVALTSPGALIFSLDGQFLGLAVVESGTLAIASAREVVATADQLASLSSQTPFDAGIAVQALTTVLAQALGVEHGVVIAQVDPTGPAAHVLQASDVVTSVNGRSVDSEDELLLRIAQQMPGRQVALTIVRERTTRTVELKLPGPSADSDPPSTIGLEVQARRGAGTVVSGVTPGTPAAAAGLLVGDVIVHAGGLEGPTPSELTGLIEKREPGEFVVLVIQRDGLQHVTALGRVRQNRDAIP